MVLPSGSSFQLFVGGEEALGRAAAVRTHTLTSKHTHSLVIARDTSTHSSLSHSYNYFTLSALFHCTFEKDLESFFHSSCFGILLLRTQ